MCPNSDPCLTFRTGSELAPQLAEGLKHVWNKQHQGMIDVSTNVTRENFHIAAKLFPTLPLTGYKVVKRGRRVDGLHRSTI